MDTGAVLNSMATAMQAHWQPATGQSGQLLHLNNGGNSFWAAVALVLGQGDPSPSSFVVEALRNLPTRCTTPSGLLALPEQQFLLALGKCAKRAAVLRRFCLLADQHAENAAVASLGGLAGMETGELFETLLRVNGLGLETVEALLLHVFCRPVFPAGPGVYRVALRHGLVPEEVSREEVAAMFVDWLGNDIALLQSLHRHLRLTAAVFCKAASPACLECPLEGIL